MRGARARFAQRSRRPWASDSLEKSARVALASRENPLARVKAQLGKLALQSASNRTPCRHESVAQLPKFPGISWRDVAETNGRVSIA